MAVEYKLNRLDTSAAGVFADEHWKSLRDAKAQGKKVVWSSGPLFIYTYSVPNVSSHFMAGYAAYCGGRRMAEEVLEAAEKYGELKDTCSYHRLHTGMASIIMKGLSVADPRVLLPVPDLLVGGRHCTEMSHYMEALHRRFGTKAVTIDIPRPRSIEDLPRLARFVTEQVRETLIPALEQLGGCKFDEDRMREILKMWKETCLVRNQCWEFLKRKPALWTLWDFGVFMSPVVYGLGKPEGLVCYQNLLKQLQERAEKNITAVHPNGEKYRLYWDGWLPWAFLGRFMRILVPKGAIPICGRYPWEAAPIPEDINPEADDIIFEWNRLFYLPQNMTLFHNSPWGAEDFISQLVQDYSIDGMIYFSSKTCRQWNMGQQQIINHIEKKLGVPGVVIEADMVDASMFSEEQIRTRIEALLETIDARRK